MALQNCRCIDADAQGRGRSAAVNSSVAAAVEARRYEYAAIIFRGRAQGHCVGRRLSGKHDERAKKKKKPCRSGAGTT